MVTVYILTRVTFKVISTMWVLHVDPTQSLNSFKSSLSKGLGRLMLDKLCFDASMYMLMIVAEMYEG